MTKKQLEKLEAIENKYSGNDDDESAMISQTAFAMSEGSGHWCKDGKPFRISWYNAEGIIRGTGNAIFWKGSETDGLIGVKRLKSGKLFAFNDNDYQCEIKDPDLIAVIKALAHIQKSANKPKAKKPAKKAKKFKVWFQVMGSSTDSNNIGYAIIQAKDEEQAIEFARQDLTKGVFKNVVIDCGGVNDEDDEQEDDDGTPLYNYATNWTADAEHGKYCAQGGPYAHDEKEAVELQREDLTENGFMGFETDLEAEEEL